MCNDENKIFEKKNFKITSYTFKNGGQLKSIV